jgi:hypothetical protein
MKRAAGLWIDHRKALIVFISDDGEESKEIESDMEKHTRFSGGSRSEQGRGGRPTGSPIQRPSQRILFG